MLAKIGYYKKTSDGNSEPEIFCLRGLEKGQI
jgi:hypothetical protein